MEKIVHIVFYIGLILVSIWVIYYISKSESHLHLEDWIYEFINLSIPMQRMCKEDEIGGPQCNLEVLDRLKKMEEDAKAAATNTIWKGLDQFKDLQ